MDKGRGIIYLLSDLPSSELLVVSLWSLRQVYEGPVTVFSTKECEPVTQAIRDDARLNVDIRRTERPTDCRRPDWVSKAFCYLQSPYQRTTYLDADTIVLRNPDELTAAHPGAGFICATCNDHRLRDDHNFCNSIRKQLAWMRSCGPVISRMIDEALEVNLPVCNNGVLSFEKDSPILYEIHHLTYGLRRERMHDEIAIHLCLPRYPDVVRVSGKWNAMARYQDDFEGSYIAHLHHKTYANNNRGRPLWRPWFRKAIDHNVANIAQWGGIYSRHVDSVRQSRMMGDGYARTSVGHSAGQPVHAN